MKAVVSVVASLKARGFPQFWSRHHGDIFAQDLPADRERPAGREPGEGCSGLDTERGSDGCRVDEDIGIDEAHRPSSSYISSRRRLSPSGQGPRS